VPGTYAPPPPAVVCYWLYPTLKSFSIALVLGIRSSVRYLTRACSRLQSRLSDEYKTNQGTMVARNTYGASVLLFSTDATCVNTSQKSWRIFNTRSKISPCVSKGFTIDHNRHIVIREIYNRCFLKADWMLFWYCLFSATCYTYALYVQVDPFLNLLKPSGNFTYHQV
jgi:hypothetical protein